MEVIYLLIPTALIIVGVIIGIFFWAVKSNQFEDLEGPAHRIIMDDDDKPASDDADDSTRKQD